MQALGPKKQPVRKNGKKTRFHEGEGLSPLGLFARRFFHRAEARVETLPRFFGSAATAALVGGFSLYGMILGGHTDAFVNSSTAMMGFGVKAVTISGHQYMRERDILDILGLEPGVSLVTFNVSAAHQTLLREPWVENASVRKVYPGKLQINLTEREPFAIWQRGQIVSVVDQEGLVLDDFDEDLYGSLPILVGHGAQRQGAKFLSILEDFPSISSRVRASLLRSERRWDLLLDNKITVKLPETQVRKALARLASFDDNEALLSKDIVSVDMRLQDRLVMRLSDDAMITRRAALKRRKEAKAREKKI